MSDYRTRAVAQVEINGNAGPELEKLKKRADDFRDAIARAYKEGNDKLAKKLARELKSTEKQIRQIQSQTANVEMTLRRLDKASPKELRQTLKQMEKDLQKIERGSAAWNTQTRRIKLVKAELEKVNAELKIGEGRWSKFNRILNDWQMTIAGAAAAVTGLVMAGKAAVQVYADLDAEMASVRKFTGMTAAEVEQLNEAFKQIDTRTSREDLNKLAQEAGRLGLTSQQDVLGFVKAANQINVALDDLGEGATLTLSKLTDIFGDKQRLGVEQSLLSVGSVINELSQNCTASAPYLAQFAQRMAGVGAQARMTIPEIMGLAAVLDSQGQAVEMSATAVSKLIMDMFKQQDKVIKATGINAEKFKETLKRSTNEGLLMLIERLHELGNIDVLAPVFKDMGENGARAAQVISALAGNLEKVKWEQGEAAKAFAEATSVTKEYEVQNNTVQAQLDKARKGFTEMAAALGEKLMPVMRYFISSTSAMMRGMSIVVDFIAKYKGAIVTLAASIAAYTVAVNASNIALRLHYTWLVIVEKAQAIGRATVLLCSVAYNKLTGNITRADAAQKMLNTTMKMNPWGLVLAAVTALGVAIYKAATQTDAFTKSVKEQISAANGATQEYVKEQRELDLLFGKLKGAEKGSDDYKSAKKAIIDQYGRYLSGLIDEKGEIINLTDAYDRLTEAIRRSAKERGIANARQALEDKYTQQTAEDLQRLQQSLEKYGVSAAQAAEVVQQVATSMATGKPIPRSALDVIEKASKDMPWYSSWRWGKKNTVTYEGPAGIVNNMYRHQGEYNKGQKTLDAMERGVNPYSQFNSRDLDAAIERLEKLVATHDYGSALVLIEGTNQVEFQQLTPVQAQALLNKYREEKAYRGGGGSAKPEPAAPNSPYKPTKDDKNKKKHEDKFKAEKEWKEREEALNTIAYRTGEKNYEEYMIRQLQIEVEYNQKRLKNSKITADEYIKVNAELQEALAKQSANYHKMSLADEEAAYNEQVAHVQQYYLENLISREAYEGKLKELEMEHLWRLDKLQQHAASLPGADESTINAAQQAHEKYQQRLIQDQMENQKAYEDKLKKHQEELGKIWEGYFVSDEQKRRQHYEATKKLIDEVFEREMQKEGYTAEEKLQLLEAYKRAIAKLDKETESEQDKFSGNHSITDRAKNALHKALKGKYGDSLFDEDALAAVDQTIDNVVASFSSMYETLGQMWRNEEEMKLAALETRYNREISMAEGNAYKIKELEKKKAREQALIRAEAQKRQFAQQVLSAIAQTATAAINAYSSAAAIPVVGHVLAPIAAAMATAAGLMQVAVIKQQQTLSNAQGYSKGGFTPDGPADKPVGIVHAGEWVASQKLLKNPATRPAIEALDFAQRNNTFGSIRQEDVTRHVTAPAIIAGATSDGSMERAIIAMSAVLGQYQETMQRLGSRLDEPFVTIATVSGDKGIKQAQDEYQRLQNNSLPKSKRK